MFFVIFFPRGSSHFYICEVPYNPGLIQQSYVAYRIPA